MTVKIISYQWYWGFEYPDHGGFAFDSRMVQDSDLKPGQLRKLEVDNRMVVPANTRIRLLVTSQDVIHNFAVPAFAVKVDTVPGRINETWIEVKDVGVYYGQCSELCGPDHSNMPVAVEVVTKEQFAAWVDKAKKQFAKQDGGEPVSIATVPADSARPQ